MKRRRLTTAEIRHPLYGLTEDWLNGDYPDEGAPHPEKADDTLVSLTVNDGRLVVGQVTAGWLRMLLGDTP